MTRERMNGFTPSEREINRPPTLETRFYPGSTVVTNADIESWGIQTGSGALLTAENIASRTGIERRHVASDDETPFRMGLAAAAPLVQDRPPYAFYVATSYPTGERFADEFSQRLNISPRIRQEVYAACSGSARAFADMKEHEDELMGKDVVLVATEKYSPTLVDLRESGIGPDPSLAQTLFSDGAVALRGRYGHDFQVLHALNHSFPDVPDHIRNSIRMPIDRSLIGPGAIQEPVPPSASGYFEQDGALVYRAVSSQIPKLIEQAVEESGLRPEDIRAVIPHQGSGRIVDAVQKGLSPHFDHKVVLDYQDGNFSSGSILKAFRRAVQEGLIHKDDPVVFAGFGAGMFASIAVFRA